MKLYKWYKYDCKNALNSTVINQRFLPFLISQTGVQFSQALGLPGYHLKHHPVVTPKVDRLKLEFGRFHKIQNHELGFFLPYSKIRKCEWKHIYLWIPTLPCFGPKMPKGIEHND